MKEVVKKWYAVYTRPKWEKKVAALLTMKEIENYCPLNRVIRQWSDRKKISDEPLFTSYVFVRSCQREYISVLETDGVINYVNWLGRPAVIPDSEIELIKEFLLEYRHVKLEKITVNVNDTVEIKHGVFIEQKGRVVEVYNKTVKVLLPSLGYIMLAEVPKCHVEVIKKGSETK
jgi:transcription antitermination factor NusG